MQDQIESFMVESSEKIKTSLKSQFVKIRTGRASANVLDGITVDYYGSATPINQVGQISTPEARLLQIQPFDKSIIGEIEKAIINSNIGVTPSNDGNFIRLNFPQLTEEKRKDLVKQIKKIGEDARVAMRNARRDQNDIIKKAEKDKVLNEDESKKFQSEVQKFTDKYIKDIDEIIESKEKELMTV
ncbi:ribosome recycling factor [Bacteriovoracaceae bacterium]|nr:ribosome recycling factor [Bacteriovoracaceae bacterium]